MRFLTRAAVLGSLTSVLAGGTATGQLIGVWTANGGLSGPGCTQGVCQFGDYRLWFEDNGLGGPPFRHPGDFVPLGSFWLQCGSGGPNFDTCPSGIQTAIPAGITFTLVVAQISQDLTLNGGFSVPGTFSGFVEWDPYASTITWTPLPAATLGFGPALWTIRAVRLNPPFPGLATNPRETGFGGSFIIAPEPATAALVATGLLALLTLTAWSDRRRYNR